jgi:hypothetical protein
MKPSAREMLDTLQHQIDGWLAAGVCPQCLGRTLILLGGMVAKAN